jgi:photosystem II stability/assembly factor-like uncharacterized protein
MSIVLGTNDGVWSVNGGAPVRMGLDGKRILHVALSGEVALAAVAGEGVFALDGSSAVRAWEGDAHSCAVGPGGEWYAGIEPAMVFRSRDRGATWTRLSTIDELPTRGEWTFPPPPHQPHVLSIDSLPGRPETVLAGIEVGGVILSEDGGETWREMNRGIYVDVHSVRPHPSDADQLFAVTGAGFYASDDGGNRWERRMAGIGGGYTIGLAVSGSGELMVTATDGPQGMNGKVFRSGDGGHTWEAVLSERLQQAPRRASVPFFDGGVAMLGGHDGRLFREERDWEEVAALPAAINVIASPGRTSSVMH